LAYNYKNTTMPKPTLTILAGTFTIHRLAAQADIPQEVTRAGFFAITRTDEELSIVAPARIAVPSERSDPGWACLKVDGPLDFSLVGILSGLSTALAEAGISLFALSTFDTDYILVKAEKLAGACQALKARGYEVHE